MAEDPARREVEAILSTLTFRKREYLRSLMGDWVLLSDLCFSDLLLYLPLPGNDQRFVVVGQVRPGTSQTVHKGDLLGAIFDAEAVPAVDAAFQSGAMSYSETKDLATKNLVVTQCIPLRVGGQVFAAMARDYMLNPHRVQGELESTYVNVFERFAKMIREGSYPYSFDDSFVPPRVGDGVILLEEDLRISYMSPNAVSALHRLGVSSPVSRVSLAEQGVEIEGLEDLDDFLSPVFEEVQGPSGGAVIFYLMPLLDGSAITGFLLLIQDVTNLRESERLLLSKDATIREIHHRVKNNLQTISSLLRLQARRLVDPLAREALREAERRIRSIAVVHEILSKEIGEQVSAGEIVEAIVNLAHESAPIGREVRILVEGTLGELDASLATPLAVILQELIQNSLEHAFPLQFDVDDEPEVPLETLVIQLEFTRGDDGMEIWVRDNGSGFPPDFALESSNSLGLLIVRDLVRSQLLGTLRLSGTAGAEVHLEIPLGLP